MLSTSPRRLLAASALAMLVVASACSSDDAGPAADQIDLTPATVTDPSVTSVADVDADPSDGPEPTTSEPEANDDEGQTTEPDTRTTTSPETTSVTTTTPTTDDASPDPDDPRFDILEPRVGTWVVGDAGEIDVDLTADGLVLLDVRAASGWQVSVDEDAPDEIEVDFEMGPVEWEIEIEWENGILEIEIDQDIEPAEPGVVVIGIAGSVEFDVNQNGLVMVEIIGEDGWEIAVTEDSADEIEVLFVSGQAEYVLEIELDDGEIEIEVDFEVEGPFTP